MITTLGATIADWDATGIRGRDAHVHTVVTNKNVCAPLQQLANGRTRLNRVLLIVEDADRIFSRYGIEVFASTLCRPEQATCASKQIS